MSDEEELVHYGILTKSGRYPWGSGDEPYQRLHKPFLAYVAELEAQGLSQAQIAEGMGIKTTQLRALKSNAKTESREADRAQIVRMKEKQMSNMAISRQLGIPEATVRNMLKPSAAVKATKLETTAGMLKDSLKENKYIDIGTGTENQMGVSITQLGTAVALLESQGYKVVHLRVPQLGTSHETTVKVLAPEGTHPSEIYNNLDEVGTVIKYSEDGGRTSLGLEPPRNVSSDRVYVRYAEEGGAAADGVIYIRPGVDDISLGHSRYAQVRIGVDGDKYLKGMAMYSNDIPEGHDMVFNTNKSDKGDKRLAMKDVKRLGEDGPVDTDNPFGATVRQRHYTDAKGKTQLSALNIVNEEGKWDEWSRNLPSQMLSKQPVSLARRQLEMVETRKKQELAEINRLTNPAIRRKLLESFADGADSASVHLKAASLPRQSTHVILPINDLPDNEIYAPKFKQGENVALVRFPHGGKFEIPELKVNNRNPSAKSALGNAEDAVGINANVASRLSGADFDGDTVLVIPNDSGAVRTSAPLRELSNFDPQASYPGFPGMKVMSEKYKQTAMGEVSNLITDMTIRGATNNELARAVKHSMVVIDAEKHKLNYKQSAKDNSILELKKKYQGKADGSPGGASTLISRASSDKRVPERRPARVNEVPGGPINPRTGEKQFVETGNGYTNAKGEFIPKTVEVPRMSTVKDAQSLSSGTPMEQVYVKHANSMKSLGNQARKDMVAVKSTPYSPSARATYRPQVDALSSKLDVALQNRPLERQAQLIGNTVVQAKQKAQPEMDKDSLKRLKSQALAEARTRVGASKKDIVIEPKEWEAIQAGAISNNMLKNILDNTDLDKVKELATPRAQSGITPAMEARMRAMVAQGYTLGEVADALGVSASTVSAANK